MNVKGTIEIIMQVAVGLRAHSSGRVFSLQDNVQKGTDTFLFVDKIRYDVAGHIMVLDGFVLTVSDEILPQPHNAAGQHVPTLRRSDNNLRF